ncbi:hypothetical protein F4806DRAFT_260537 [Annulohypoxylon nitens]|nr:hypothetical protein F4806DRAFT_260537 [Annulohypoxylon nitens]
MGLLEEHWCHLCRCQDYATMARTSWILRGSRSYKLPVRHRCLRALTSCLLGLKDFFNASCLRKGVCGSSSTVEERAIALAVDDLHDANLSIIASLPICIDLPFVLYAAPCPASYPTHAHCRSRHPDRWIPYLTGCVPLDAIDLLYQQPPPLPLLPLNYVCWVIFNVGSYVIDMVRTFCGVRVSLCFRSQLRFCDVGNTRIHCID